MKQCESCGNHYHSPFEVTMAGKSHVFDCFECAIHALAPKCAHCGCRVIGHGIEGTEVEPRVIYCCTSCARHGAQKAANVHDREITDSTMDA